ncbi:blue (type 1) copper domain protein [Pseudopedobacter saltans DSM 12145]|uniref:Blue (Type 1) copper domain protein n=1 Tax=Pseudopedobacter saltans (strain ATCC 51119 / DSM 12145 / JCM 21818 / CCUG 39354 / LMG 10337 / NBRC 100064 / NCIMB 13643) TaxID=762903 RepID=F0S8J9_PSESL|nr:plastocyanin/azurin family copper-binding protein [Pseudopedobacter saltans]ADY51283.1 blue (type 1) copper domain protein [Pseudopedobacter saltans DSM 12145]
MSQNILYKIRHISRLSIIMLLLLVLHVLPSTGYQKDKVVEIELNVLPGLQFNLPRFHVKPGQQVKIIFTNTDDMDHNLLIINPGTREKIVQKAMEMGVNGLKNNYVPNDTDILWSTPILHDGQTKTLTFKAPEKEGIYPYVCTLPGHGFIMYGAMYVNSSGIMPPLENDVNVSPSRMHAESPHVHHKPQHPYELRPPYLYRLYIEGSSPAAIAVHLPGKLSYCWDAGECRLRFAWAGDFVDNTKLWKGHKDAQAAILGDIFYTENKNPVIRIGRNAQQKSQFKGYKIVEGGYPEFHYTINGTDVFELIKELKEGNGIMRSFRVPALKDKLYLNYTSSKNTEYYFNGKKLSGELLELKPDAGAKFNVELRIIK